MSRCPDTSLADEPRGELVKAMSRRGLASRPIEQCGRWLWRGRYHLRRVFGTWPTLYLLLARALHHDAAVCRAAGPTTELVIEGFPRSANTFAVAAFRSAQPSAIELAHHLHMPAQVIYAARHHIPCLVLIREPVAAICSYVLLRDYPWNDPDAAITEYVRFYSAVAPYSPLFTLATFDEVTTDFGAVIDRVNHQFETTFTTPTHDQTLTQQCFSQADVLSRRHNGGRIAARETSRPVERRKQAKAAVEAKLKSQRYITQLAQAERVYQALLDERAHQTRMPQR